MDALLLLYRVTLTDFLMASVILPLEVEGENMQRVSTRTNERASFPLSF